MNTIPTNEIFGRNGYVRCREVAVVFAFAVCGLFPTVVSGNPQDGQVVAGSATIQQTSAKRLDVIQHTPKAVINWRQFNIGAGEHTNFRQPSSSAMALNRVVGGDISRILGRLTANGQIYLINPAGVFFGRGGHVDVAALVVSTADIRAADFMSGRYDFSMAGLPNAKVVNEGQITIAEGGFAVFVAPWAKNSGVIAVRRGKVALCSGETFALDLYGDSLIQIAAAGVPSPDTSADGGGVTNDGRISADGGVVYLTAKGMDRALKSVVNTSGIIEAKSLRRGERGEIILEGGVGAVEVSGRLDASGEEGGRISVTGSRIDVSNGARVDASGADGGGWIAIKSASAEGRDAELASIDVATGAHIVANSQRRGDGGNVSILSDGTTDVAGAISVRGGIEGGDGGSVEVSGWMKLNFTGHVDASAPAGRLGSLLLDPAQYTVDAANVAAINNAAADVTVQADNLVDVNTDIRMSNAGVALMLQAPTIDLLDCNQIQTNNGNLTLQGNTTAPDTLNLKTKGGDFTANGRFSANGPRTVWVDTKVNGRWGNKDANDGQVLFNGDVDMAGTRLGIAAGNGTVTFQNHDMEIGGLGVWDCWDFINNGTIHVSDSVIIGARRNVHLGFNSLLGLVTTVMSITSASGGAVTGLVTGGDVHFSGFDTVDLNVNVTDITIDGNPTGQVTGNVQNNANIPPTLVDNTNQGGNNFAWEDIFADLDQYFQAQQTLDDAVTGQPSDTAENEQSNSPSQFVAYQFGDTTLYWPDEYFEAQNQLTAAENDVYSIQGQLTDLDHQDQQIRDEIADDRQQIKTLNQKLQRYQNNLSNLLAAEDQFVNDPQAHQAWLDNVVLYQDLINRTEDEIANTQETIRDQMQAIQHIQQQQEDLNQQLAAAQQNAQEAQQQMQNIEQELESEIEQVVQQSQQQAQESNALGTGEEQQEQQTSQEPSRQPTQAQNEEPTPPTGGQPTEDQTSVASSSVQEYSIDLEIQLESSWVFWDKPLSAEDVSNALGNELLLGDSYQEGTDPALDALSWHERAQNATESMWAVAGAVVDGAMQATTALREAGEGVEAIVETIEGSLDTYNTWADRADKVEQFYNLVASRLQQQGWDTHTQVLNYQTQTVTATTYFNRQTGEYYTTITRTPTGNSLTPISALSNLSAANPNTSFTQPTTSVVHGHVNTTEPSLLDRIVP